MPLAEPKIVPRFKERYASEIRPALIERFEYSTPMRAPRITKITLNIGGGDAQQHTNMPQAATAPPAGTAGQRRNLRRARTARPNRKPRAARPVRAARPLGAPRAERA